MATKIQVRRDSAADWNITNPILAEGEIGYETDTGKIKVGNGSQIWTSLEYFGEEVDLSGYLTSSSASSTYLTQTSASSTYLTQSSASTNYITQASASTTYATKESPSINSGIDFYSASAGFVGEIIASDSIGREIKTLVQHPSNGSSSTMRVTPSEAEIISFDGTQYANHLVVYPTYTTVDYGIRLNISEKTGDYTLTVEDNGDFIKMNSASANILTIPELSDSLVPVGSQITVMQTGTGQTTIAAGSGITVNATPGLKLRTQWSSATLIKLSSTMWVVVGDLVA